MRQNPLQLVAIGVCLNGMLLSVVSGENTSAASGGLRWTPIELPLDLLLVAM